MLVYKYTQFTIKGVTIIKPFIPAGEHARMKYLDHATTFLNLDLHLQQKCFKAALCKHT